MSRLQRRLTDAEKRIHTPDTPEIRVYFSGQDEADVPPEAEGYDDPAYCAEADDWIDAAAGTWTETTPGSGVQVKVG
jgi:hypothetical protein